MKYTKSFNGFKYTYSIDITLKKPGIINLLFKKLEIQRKCFLIRY